MSARPVRAKKANTRLAAYQVDPISGVPPPNQSEVGDQADLVLPILPAPLAVPSAPELCAGGGLGHMARRGGGGQDCRGGRGRAGGRRNPFLSLPARPPGVATPRRPSRLAFTPASLGLSQNPPQVPSLPTSPPSQSTPTPTRPSDQSSVSSPFLVLSQSPEAGQHVTTSPITPPTPSLLPNIPPLHQPHGSNVQQGGAGNGGGGHEGVRGEVEADPMQLPFLSSPSQRQVRQLGEEDDDPDWGRLVERPVLREEMTAVGGEGERDLLGGGEGDVSAVGGVESIVGGGLRDLPGGGDEDVTAAVETDIPPTVPASQELLVNIYDLPPYHIVHRTHIPTITHIPKGARVDWTRLLTNVCSRVASNPSNLANHILLSMLARVILPAGKTPPHPGNTTQAAKIKERIRRWKIGEFRSLWDEAIATQKAPSRRGRKKQQQDEVSQETRNAVRSSRLVKDGQYSRAAQALTSAGLAQKSRTTMATMQALHPQGPLVQPSDAELTIPSMRFSGEQVAKGIKTFKAGSAPGPSGLRAEHLKIATFKVPTNLTAKAIEAITKLVNVLAAGNLPEYAAPYFTGARLFAGNKKCGGVRPIAVGDIIRRLVSKCFSWALAEKAAGLLAPFQLGVGVRGGCEALVHTVRAIMEDLDTQLDNSNVLQVDIINAFNTADRATAFRDVREHFPEVARWLEATYGTQAELIWGDMVIPSCKGFHQGDPLACLFFSVVLHPIIKRIAEEVPDLLLNGWYLDDGVQVGKLADLSKVIHILLQDGPARGLILSTQATIPSHKKAKSTIWCPALDIPDMDPLDLGVPRIQEHGIILLGSPVGSHTYVKDKIQEKIQAVKDIIHHLPLLQDPHSEFVLLRSCFSLPKTMFLLRTTQPSHQDLWATFDDLIRDSLTHILGSGLNDQQWSQAQMPVAMGGLGLRSAETHSAGAYISSVLSSEILKQGLLPHGNVDIDLVPAISLLGTKIQDQEDMSREDLVGLPQKALSYKADFHHQLTLAHSLTDIRDKARLASLGLPHTGDWLNTIPSPILGLHLRPQEFRYSVLYRLGAPIYPSIGPCSACQKPSDRYGDHALVCANAGERIARHNNLRDALFQAAASANLAPRKEEQALLPGNNAKPADVLIPHWTGGRDTALDVVVSSPLLADRVARSADTPGHTLTLAFNRKCSQSLQACEREGIVFIPISVETLGGWHKKAEDQVKRIARAQARSSGKEEDVAIKQLFQKLGVLLVKGNAAMLLNRIPTFHP